MIEASALARMKKQEYVSAPVLEEAYAARVYRANLVEEIYMEEYDRDMIKVQLEKHGEYEVLELNIMLPEDKRTS